VNDHTNYSTAERIAILLPSLAGGGAERSMLHLVQSFLDQGWLVDLLLFRHKGAYLDQVPGAAHVTVLEPGSSLRGRLAALKADPSGVAALLLPVLLPIKADENLRHIESLANYLKEKQPAIMLSALTYTNLVALWAKRLAGVSTSVIVSERIALSTHIGSKGRCCDWRWRFLLPVVSRMYKAADGVVTVSDSVANDLVESTHIDRNSIRTIYNPVVDTKLFDLANEPLSHPWFTPGQPPVILGAGRLIAQKDFHTLLKAFAAIRGKRNVRLIILGEGKLRPELEALANELGISSDVKFEGFVENPYNYMANSAVFALTSLYEGLPGVLIQALACGCPVVSTDCPGGSAEILERGRYGKLVPVGNVSELAAALETVLDNPPDRDSLRNRAGDFSVGAAAKSYLDYFSNISSQKTRHSC
jgi:glycosyltransferase involved in cell wall biosynthesis